MLVALTIMRVDTMSTKVTLFFSTMLVTITSDMLRVAEMMVPARGRCVCSVTWMGAEVAGCTDK